MGSESLGGRAGGEGWGRAGGVGSGGMGMGAWSRSDDGGALVDCQTTRPGAYSDHRRRSETYNSVLAIWHTESPGLGPVWWWRFVVSAPHASLEIRGTRQIGRSRRPRPHHRKYLDALQLRSAPPECKMAVPRLGTPPPARVYGQHQPIKSHRGGRPPHQVLYSYCAEAPVGGDLFSLGRSIEYLTGGTRPHGGLDKRRALISSPEGSRFMEKPQPVGCEAVDAQLMYCDGRVWGGHAALARGGGAGRSSSTSLVWAAGGASWPPCGARTWPGTTQNASPGALDRS